MTKYRSLIIYALLILLVIFFTNALLGDPNKDKQIEYTGLLQMIKDNEIQEILVKDGTVYALLKGSAIQSSDFPDQYDKKSNLLYANQFDNDVAAIEGSQDKLTWNFTYDSQPPDEPSLFVTLLPYILMIGAVLVFIYIVFQQNSQSGNSRVFSFGRSKAQMLQDKTGVTFNDVAGADEEKEELKEVVDFLKDKERFVSLGARIPKGILLVGQPGTGKTLLAKAVAGEAHVPFFSTSGSEFVEMFVGVGASRVRDMFTQAKRNAPCIIFIDEIDAVGRHRGAGLGGGHDEREQTLNQLLVEMDGFNVNDGIIVLAATNRVDILDPALLRPGRFDRNITVHLPDAKGREEIFAVHSRNKPLGDDVSPKVIAQLTSGFTGADIENLLNEAALLTARNNKKVITMKELREAVIRVIAGPEKKSWIFSQKTKRHTAYHEAGHAMVSYIVPNGDPVHQVTIIPRGNALGMTITLPNEEEILNMTQSHLTDTLAMLLAGRVTEEIIYGDVSTGAYDDLKRATLIARRMVTEFGMSKLVGPVFLGKEQEIFLGRDFSSTQTYSDELASKIDAEVKRILDEQYAKAGQIVNENREKLERIVDLLMEREKIEAPEFISIMEDKPVEECAEEIKKNEEDGNIIKDELEH